MSCLKKTFFLLAAIFIAAVTLIAVSFQQLVVEKCWVGSFPEWGILKSGNGISEWGWSILISTNEPGDGELYVYFPSIKQIGVPNGNQFIFLGFCAYNTDLPVPVVLSSNRIKIETDMNIIEQNEWVEFTGIDGREIRLYRSTL